MVDWQGATSGDAAFDLVTLAYYSPAVVIRDHFRGGRLVDPRTLERTARTWCCGKFDWCLRNHDDLAVWWFHDLGTDLLDTLRTA